MHLDSSHLALFRSLHSRNMLSGSICYPNLGAIVTCFKRILHVLTELESSTRPPICLVFSLLEKCNHQLSQSSCGGSLIGDQLEHGTKFLFQSRVAACQKYSDASIVAFGLYFKPRNEDAPILETVRE